MTPLPIDSLLDHMERTLADPRGSVVMTPAQITQGKRILVALRETCGLARRLLARDSYEETSLGFCLMYCVLAVASDDGQPEGSVERLKDFMYEESKYGYAAAAEKLRKM